MGMLHLLGLIIIPAWALSASIQPDNNGNTIHLEISADLTSEKFADVISKIGHLAKDNVGGLTQYIVGGSDVSESGKYPWQGSLRLWGGHRCGCSLVHPQYVVTAAHCSMNPVSAQEVVFGSNYLNGSGEFAEFYQVIQKIEHPDFIFDPWIGMPNDIMLLKLATPVNLSNPHIAMIEVPPAGQDLTGAECHVTGWGAVEYTLLAPYPVLQEARVDIITNQLCIDLFDPESITDRQVCTLHEISTPCAGDSGGPLVCLVDGRWMQAGVVSWGDGCRIDLPAVFTRLSEYRDFLDTNGALDIPEALLETPPVPAKVSAKQKLASSFENLVKIISENKQGPSDLKSRKKIAERLSLFMSRRRQ